MRAKSNSPFYLYVECQKSDGKVWHESFYSLQACFGQLKPVIDVRDVFEIQVDKMGWRDSSPMIISFHCPTFLLLVGTPSKIKISLCVDVHTMTLHLVDDFGFDMSAHTAKLSDETLQLSYQPPRLPKQQVGKVATSLGVQKRCDSYHAHSLSSELEPSGRISRVRFQIPVLERSTKLSNRSKVKLVKFSTCSIVVQIDSQEP